MCPTSGEPNNVSSYFSFFPFSQFISVLNAYDDESAKNISTTIAERHRHHTVSDRCRSINLLV